MTFSQSRRASGGSKAARSSGDRDPGKWLYHSLKTIHKALKQAKNFEVRKVTRRLALARKEEANAATSSGSELVSKLEEQLQVAKQADLDVLAQQAALRAGLPVNSSQAASTASDSSSLAAAVHQRLLSASCVHKQLTQQATEFKRKFGDTKQQQQEQNPCTPLEAEPAAQVDAAADDDDDQQPSSKRQKRAAADARCGDAVAADQSITDSGSLSVSEAAISDSSELQAEGRDDDSSSSVELEAEYEAQQRQQQHGAEARPPDDSELDAATLAVMEKLRARSSAAADESSDYSGAIPDTLAAEADCLQDSDDEQQQQQQQLPQRQQNEQSKQQQPASKYPPPPPSASGPAVKPQLSKAEKLQLKKRQKLEKLLKRGKRVGQRMRRQLYEKLYGSNAKHLQDGKQQHKEHPAGREGRGSNSSRQQQHPSGEKLKHANIKGRKGDQNGSLQGRQQMQQPSKQPPGKNKQQQPQHEEQLHPSWIARKKQQQQIATATSVSAAGTKKVVFGEDGEVVAAQQPLVPGKQQQQQHPDHQHTTAARTLHQQQSRSYQKGQSRPGSLKQQSMPPAHHKLPSVLGARAAAAAIDVAQGPSQPAISQSSQLHPSWQARKQQQASLVRAQPTGKKTVFSDD